MSLLVLSVLGCLERHPVEPEPLAKPPEAASSDVDWSAYKVAITAQLDAEPNMDTDRRDQLMAALSLVDAMLAGSPVEPAVARHLDALLVIAVRAAPQDMEEVPVLAPRVTEEEIDPGFDRAIGPEDARALLAEGRYVEALRGLEPVKELHPQLWSEAVDGYVHSERERAGALFVKARAMPPGEIQDSAYDEVIAILEGLVADYPESSYAVDIQENLVTVRESASR